MTKDKAQACTADMPTDYIATNGYEYVLKSKLTESESLLALAVEALEKIAKLDGLDVIYGPDAAKQALAKIKGEE